MKFIEEPVVMFGDPRTGTPLMRGAMARAIGSLSLESQGPSKAIDLVVSERRIRHVRVRFYCASVGGKLWVSPGYVVVSWPRFFWVCARTLWRRWREPIPRAQVRR